MLSILSFFYNALESGTYSFIVEDPLAYLRPHGPLPHGGNPPYTTTLAETRLEFTHLEGDSADYQVSVLYM